MAEFIIVYLGGEQPSSPEEGKAHFSKYMEWLGSMGEAVVSAMNPIKETRTVLADGSIAEGSNTGMSGYTIIRADSLDDALELAKNCPFLQLNGTLEVSERIIMPG